MSEVHCNLLVIRSSKLERAAFFYEALGLRFTKHRHGSGPEHYAAQSTNQTFEIYPLAENAPPHDGDSNWFCGWRDRPCFSTTH